MLHTCFYFQEPAYAKSVEESGHEDNMNDAIDANLFDKEVEEWNKNRTEETHQPKEQRQEEPTDGGEEEVEKQWRMEGKLW